MGKAKAKRVPRPKPQIKPSGRLPAQPQARERLAQSLPIVNGDKGERFILENEHVSRLTLRVYIGDSDSRRRVRYLASKSAVRLTPLASKELWGDSPLPLADVDDMGKLTHVYYLAEGSTPELEQLLSESVPSRTAYAIGYRLEHGAEPMLFTPITDKTGRIAQSNAKLGFRAIGSGAERPIARTTITVIFEDGKGRISKESVKSASRRLPLIGDSPIPVRDKPVEDCYSLPVPVPVQSAFPYIDDGAPLEPLPERKPIAKWKAQGE